MLAAVRASLGKKACPWPPGHIHTRARDEVQSFIQNLGAGWAGGSAGTPLALIREDFVGGLLGGSKHRKLAEVARSAAWSQHQEWHVVGGLHSNNVVAAVQALRCAGKQAIVHATSTHRPKQLHGNALLLHMMLPPSRIRDIHSPDPACTVSALIAGVAREAASVLGGAVGCLDPQLADQPIVWEGCLQPAGLRGAASLVQSIPPALLSGSRAHVCLDVGTGCSLGGLVAALASRPAPPPTLHGITLASDTPALRRIALAASREVGPTRWPVVWHAPGAPPTDSVPSALNVFTHSPASGRAFGSVPASVARWAVTLARSCGVLADPVYTAKLLQCVAELQGHWPEQGSWAAVHGGGGCALLGHTAAMQRAVAWADSTP